MKIRPFTVYMAAKYKQYNRDLLKENYILDCLWATATDRRFIDGKKNNEPTLMRWHEAAKPKEIEPKKPKVTKETIKESLRQLLRKRGK